MKKSSRKYEASELWGYHEPTPSEIKLEKGLKKAGIEFEREVPIKQFTCDFLIDDWLVVEVDGESHVTSSRLAEDRSRQEILERSGFTVMRVRAMDLSYKAGLKECVARIKRYLEKGPPGSQKERSENLYIKTQVEKARRDLADKAREQGLKAKRQREIEAERYYAKGDEGSRDASVTSESMDDYFGTDESDFEALLKEYDWSKAPPKDDCERRMNSKKHPKS